MKALDVLELLENTASSTDKVLLLQQHKSESLSELLDAALNKQRKFYIKKFEAVAEITEEELKNPNNGRTHKDFMEMLSLLESQEIRGSGAVQYVEWFFAACDPLEIKWYSRIIRKDLRIDLKTSTLKAAGLLKITQ